MKRTAKWHKHLSMAELRHLKEMNSLSLRGIAANRAAQREWDAKATHGNFTACHTCAHIERKLLAAGITLPDLS